MARTHVAAIAALASAMSMNAKVVRACSQTRRPPAKRSASQNPAITSSVFPTAIPSDAGREPEVAIFTAKAPIQTPGHRLRPNSSRTASEIPVGGQTAVAFAFAKASASPSFPVRK